MMDLDTIFRFNEYKSKRLSNHGLSVAHVLYAREWCHSIIDFNLQNDFLSGFNQVLSVMIFTVVSSYISLKPNESDLNNASLKTDIQTPWQIQSKQKCIFYICYLLLSNYIFTRHFYLMLVCCSMDAFCCVFVYSENPFLNLDSPGNHTKTK